MSTIAEAVKAARPTLSPSSIRTYASILGSLYRKIWGSDDVELKHFGESKKILEFLKDRPAAARKTQLSSLVVLTGLDAYRQAMSQDIETFTADMAKQQNTPAQTAALISPAEIQTIYARLVVEANACYKKTHRTVSDLLTIADSVILALLGGMYIPPRRALDYCALKLRNIDPKVDNRIEKNDLVFVTYKTSKTYGEQRVTMPPALKAILTKYAKLNPTDWLLFDTKMEPLNSVKLNQRLNRIFNGRRISINALRHSFLSSRYTDFSKEEKEMSQTMTAMGSSPAMLNTYVKLD